MEAIASKLEAIAIVGWRPSRIGWRPSLVDPVTAPGRGTASEGRSRGGSADPRCLRDVSTSHHIPVRCCKKFCSIHVYLYSYIDLYIDLFPKSDFCGRFRNLPDRSGCKLDFSPFLRRSCRHEGPRPLPRSGRASAPTIQFTALTAVES